MADVQPIQRRGDKPVSSSVLKKPPPKGTDQRHPAGIFADMASDGPIIGTLVAVVDKAKNLPNLKSIGKQDPYCVLRLGKNAKKTEPDKRGGQTPKWDAELRFPVHDSADYRNLKIVVFTDDKKTELIGEAHINLDPILDSAGGGQIDGWHQCKCKGRYAGDIRVELTFWDERPRETAPLVVNTRQVTGFEKEDFKRPDKQLAGPRRPGGVPKKRELPERPKPKASKENVPPDSPDEEEEEEEEEDEPSPPPNRREKDRHRERESRDRQRAHREHRREKSRHHARDNERYSPEYDHDPYQDQFDHRHEQYGHYQNPQDFQNDRMGIHHGDYMEQNQIVPHQRHSPNPGTYPGYHEQPQWQHTMDQNMNSMVLASQNAPPPPLPNHRHVEFADNRRSMALPPQPTSHALQHRKSRSEMYNNDVSDMYQSGNSYNNQLVSSSAGPQLPRHGGYDQQYQDQSLYGAQGFDQSHQQMMQLSQMNQPSTTYQSVGNHQQTHQDQYIDQGFQSQLARASDFAPPPLPRHGQTAAFAAAPKPEFNNGSMALTMNNAPAPAPPSHRNTQARTGLPTGMCMAPVQQMQPPMQQNLPMSQPLEMYEQSFQVQSLRGPPPPLPSHRGTQYQPSPTQLQPPTQDSTSQARPRGNSEPPPYAAITDGNAQYTPQNEPQPLDYAQQVEDPYSLQQTLPASDYPSEPALPQPSGYTSITDYSQAGLSLQQRLSNLHMPQKPEHAFDPATALILSGGQPPLPSHAGTRSPHPPSPQPPPQRAERGRPPIAPISTNAPRKPLSRSPSPHPLALTPGYGPDSPGDDNNGSRSPAPFQQHTFPSADHMPQSNYHAPYVNDVTGRRSMDSSRLSLQGNSPLIQPVSQPRDANQRRRSVSPMPPLNSYSQELATTRGAPPPLPPTSHRMSQQLVYKHDPSERPGDRSNRNSGYDNPAQTQQSQSMNNNNNNYGIPDSTYQSASTSWATSQSVDEFSRDYMNHSADPVSSYNSYSNQSPASAMGQPQYNQYGTDSAQIRAASPQVAPMAKPRATSPMPMPGGRTPEPEQNFPKPVERRMTLGSTPFSPDDYDVINPVNGGYGSISRSPSGNISTSPLARSPGALATSPGQYMTPKEERKARKEEERAARKARKKYYTPNSANRELDDDDILPSDTFAPSPQAYTNPESFGRNNEEEVQPLSFRPRRQSASPQPPGADMYGSSPGGRGFKGPKSVASNTSSNPSSGYGYGGHSPATGGGSRPLPGAPVMRNAIMGPEDYYQQQQSGYGAPQQARPMGIPQQNPGNMSQEQWSLSQELSSINIGSSRRRTGTWA